MFAGESAAPLPTALRYGKRVGTRPIFTRTVCHSHTQQWPHRWFTGVPRSSATHPRRREPVSCLDLCGNYTESQEFLRRYTTSALRPGRSHLGLDPECTVGREEGVKRHRRRAGYAPGLDSSLDLVVDRD